MNPPKPFVAAMIIAFCLSQWIGNECSGAGQGRIKATPLNLVVPIEMGMIPCGSVAYEAHDFNRTKVRLNDDDYDGSPLWYFEIIARNSDIADKTITLKT